MRLQSLQKIQKAYTGNLSPELGQRLRDEFSENLFAVTESVELINVLPYLKTQDVKMVRWKLRSVLQGPFFPAGEDQNSNLARNILFELNLASKLWTVGLKPRLAVEGDIFCELDNKRILFECKRPLLQKSIKKNIREAKKTLEDKITSDVPGTRGVISISFSKVLNPQDAVLQYFEEESAKAALGDILQNITSRPDIKIPLGQKIIGLLFHIITPALDRQTSGIALGEQINAEAIKPEGSRDYRIFWNISQALAKLT